MAVLRNMLAGRFARSAGFFLWPALAGLLLAASALAAPPKPTKPPAPPPQPRAYILGVEQTSVPATHTRFPGPGVRTFQEPTTEVGGAERFTIHWQSPPRVPLASGVVLFEYVHERSPQVRNHTRRIDGPSRASVRTPIDIPAHELRQWGPVVRWRASIVWKGRVLARKTSDTWTRPTR